MKCPPNTHILTHKHTHTHPATLWYNLYPSIVCRVKWPISVYFWTEFLQFRLVIFVPLTLVCWFFPRTRTAANWNRCCRSARFTLAPEARRAFLFSPRRLGHLLVNLTCEPWKENYFSALPHTQTNALWRPWFIVVFNILSRRRCRRCSSHLERESHFTATLR